MNSYLIRIKDKDGNAVSPCKVTFLQPDGTPVLNPQNNQPVTFEVLGGTNEMQSEASGLKLKFSANGFKDKVQDLTPGHNVVEMEKASAMQQATAKYSWLWWLVVAVVIYLIYRYFFKK